MVRPARTGRRPDRRPVIRLRAGLHTVVAERSEQAILDAGLPVFVGAAGVVYPAAKEVETVEGIRTTMTQLVNTTTPMMLQFMDQAARYEKFDVRRKAWVPAKPPKEIAELMLARKGFWPYPEVIGVITAPTIDMGGNVIMSPGLDRKSKLLLSGAPVIEMAEWPTRDDALAALETLEALLDEYQFSDDPSRSVALSMMISPLIRALLPLVPLHCVSAPVAGSGKSYLSSLASAIASGRYCPVIPPADKKEEFEKRLIGALLTGMPIISFDNVNGVLDDGTLCQALEQRIIEIRPLGTSKTVTIEQRTTWFANGNNIEVARDLTRRTVMCRLDRNDERPELHEYNGRPFERVIRDRARYIAACLTIVRAYIVAGRPGKLAPLASFEEWSDNVRSALVWLGRADPCDSMVAVRQGDSKLQKLRVLFLAWATTLGIGMEYLAKDIVKIATDRKNGSPGIHGEPATDPDPELWDALYDCCGSKNEIEAKALGEYLSRHKDSVHTITPDDGEPLRVKLVREEDSHSKRAKWALNEC